ncbi:MAG: hypothetical protein ACREMV_16090 [Gemmatimonadales bacterium]
MFSRAFTAFKEPVMPSPTSMHSALAACVALAALVTPARAPAQNRLDVIPFIGSYYALSPLGLQAVDREEQHDNEVALGASLLVRLSQTVGIEASFAYTPSGTNLTSTVAADTGYAGSIIFAGARARFWVPRTNFYGLAGVGVVSRGGEAWDFPGLTELTDIAGVGGFGVQAEVSPTIRIDLKFELQVYSCDPDGSGNQYESKTLVDVLATVGVPIRLAGR